METLQALQMRKSVRSYLAQAVEQEKLARIVEAGQNAPIAGGLQISVIECPKLLREINETAHAAMKNSGVAFLMQRAAIPAYSPLYDAPVLILLSAPPDLYSQANAACAATCMILAAIDQGLGTCYVMTPTLALDGENELSKKAGLEEGHVPFCGVLVGYEGAEKVQRPQRPAIPVNYVR